MVERIGRMRRPLREAVKLAAGIDNIKPNQLIAIALIKYIEERRRDAEFKIPGRGKLRKIDDYIKSAKQPDRIRLISRIPKKKRTK